MTNPEGIEHQNDVSGNTQHRNTEETKEIIKEEVTETDHTVVINHRERSYRAMAGTIVLRDEAEKANAAIFFVAYTLNDVSELTQRPITFSFNGGPGSSSVWMHLGLLGPRRVQMDDAGEGQAPRPPYQLINNDDSLLDKTDLIFIDPVSTGYSRPADVEEAKTFHSREKDMESVGEFIRLYVTRHQRWASPKFLIGESYGTTRAAGLAGYLQGKGMYLNGVMLISSILNFQTTSFSMGNDLAYILFLPTYTAAAWYHRALGPDLRRRRLHSVLREVEAFAIGEYTLALMQGTALGSRQRAQVVQQLSRYTGLSTAFIERSNLRVKIGHFTKELLRHKQLTIGRFDSRINGIDRNEVEATYDYDPSMATVLGVYTTMVNHYLRHDLKVEIDRSYNILAGVSWDFGQQNAFVNVAETLRQAMTKNPYLHVFVASGYYDLATPYFATIYTFNHLDLAPALRPNITMAYYEAGHMMYTHTPSLIKLKHDIDAFIDKAVLTTQ